MGLFRTAAPFYAAYRPWYPDRLIDRLAAAAGLTASSRVLDLGAGPGHVALPLAARVAEVVALDVEPAMLAQVEAPNVRTVEAPAESVDETWGRFDLVTAGRSFHWFDQDVMFARLPRLTSQLALLGESIWRSSVQSSVLEIAAELIGEERAAGPGRRYVELLAASPFSDVEEIDVDDERSWTAESLIGLAYSTSFASPQRLGERRDEFERRVRARFGRGEHRERVTVSAVLGRSRDE
jgi:SAM-dependent methyltransferase